MKDLPIFFHNNISATLTHLRQQTDIVKSILASLTPNFPSIRESIIVSNSFSSCNNFYMNREAGIGHQSGWFFRDITEGADEEFSQISLYEFSIKRPDAVKFLSLPEEHAIIKRQFDSYRAIYKNTELKIKKDSYLDWLNKSKA